jgi:hypothetical protein
MISNKQPIYSILVFFALLGSCSKQHGLGPNYRDYNPGPNPIAVTNAVDYRPDPTVTASLGGDSSITITLTLTSTAGRSMKEATHVIGSSSYAAIENPASKFYNAAPLAASNNSVTFTTSVGEYLKNYPVSASNPKPTANVELANRFYFQITLDDGSVVYPTPVRVLCIQ